MNKHFAKEDTQMANKCLRLHSLSLAIRQMQTETIMRHHCTSIRNAWIKNRVAAPNAGKVVGKLDHAHVAGEHAHAQSFGKTVSLFLQGQSMQIPVD